MREPKLPSTAILQAFTFMPGSAHGDRLRYTDTLADEATKILYEMDRRGIIREAKDESDPIRSGMHEQELLKSLLVEVARRANAPETECFATQQSLMDAFTEISCELHGAPEPSLAHELIRGQVSRLLYASAGTTASARYRRIAEELGVEINALRPPEDIDTIFGFERSRKEVSKYLLENYGDTYDAMAIDAQQAPFTAEAVARTFELGLTALSARDSSWRTWTINRQPHKSALSVWGQHKVINIGMDRAPTPPARLKGLFAHEVLRHALTTVNASAVDQNLAKGLPGSEAFEEGMAMFQEYAVSGAIRDELIDRYTDTAIALGYTKEGKKVPRSALLQYAAAREELRNESRTGHDKLTESILNKKVYTHVNRIYRGSPGTDTAIGVHTKDSTYLQGFLIAGAYVENELKNGRTIDKIIEYVSQGKFDPTNSTHTEYVASLRKKETTKALALVSLVDCELGKKVLQ